MNSLSKLAAFAAWVSAAAAAWGQVPVPKFTGPIPVTAESYPFMASNRSIDPVDLSKRGYVEEEFIVRGSANVYDWAQDGGLSVKTPDAPYATRILLRRPADASRFSGNVIVEMPMTARRFDWALMWGYSHDSFMDQGDAWVAITPPASIDALKKFDPKRYADLSFANPNPSETCVAGRGGASTSGIEEGLQWDAISQVAALLKSGTAGGPLAGFNVQGVFLTAQGADILTYMKAVGPHAMLAGGKRAYDGYLIKSPGNVARIRRCAPAAVRDDPRSMIKNVGVPVIAMLAQGEVTGSLAERRPDGDSPADRFRLYEIAGGGHIDKFAYQGMPLFADEIKAGYKPAGTEEWPFGFRCTPEVPLPTLPLMRYMYDAAFVNLEQWARKGTPAPHGQPIELKDAGTPEVTVATDQYGNGLGGVRNPYVDVPVATYYTNSVGPATCREMGHVAPFDWARLDGLYGSYKNYAARLSKSVDKLVKERWLTEADGRRIKEAPVVPATGVTGEGN